MDESWRIPIGSVVPRRRSTEETRRIDAGSLDPEDFRDVFGGPPRTVVLRQFSGGDIASPSSSSYFDRLLRYHQSSFPRQSRPSYGEVFQRQSIEPQRGKVGRSLPDIVIPSLSLGSRVSRVEEDDEFYDIFGWESERRSRTRSRQSKSNSSSVLSSEEHDSGETMGPRRPWPADDGTLTSFASKLRPITIPRRRGKARSPASPEEQISRTSTVPCARLSLLDPDFEEYAGAGAPKGSSSKFFRPYISETIVDVEWMVPIASEGDGSGSGSPSSAVSSTYDIPMATVRPSRGSHGEGNRAPEASKGIILALEGEGPNGSYVMEFASGGKATESEESSTLAALDEAIAWAKEKSRGTSSPEGIGAGVGHQQQRLSQKGALMCHEKETED